MYQAQNRGQGPGELSYDKSWAFLPSEYLVEIKDFDRIYTRSNSAMRNCQIIA